ncbi:hypothetical protein, partial [Mixta calida]|uniref:hypothetical protein n=1 Tax=Mixta calida TaxID=665913 RepID=UPI0028974B35
MHSQQVILAYFSEKLAFNLYFFSWLHSVIYYISSLSASPQQNRPQLHPKEIVTIIGREVLAVGWKA